MITVVSSMDLMRLVRVSPAEFASQYEAARISSDLIREATSPFSHDGHDETFYWVTADGESGFSVRHDGELVFVFSTMRGRGDYLVRAATERGATRLDCFDGHLTGLYARHGFTEVDRAANWTPGGPDVVWMSRSV